MLEETPRIKELRQKYKIPEHYGAGWEMPDGQIHFDFCDSTIAIHPNGSATETHMGLGVEGHEFFTREWCPG